jgi:hypothetical protein
MPQIVAAERPVHKFGSYSQHTVLHDHSRAALIFQHSPRLTGLKTCAPRGRLTSSGPFSPTMASTPGAEGEYARGRTGAACEHGNGEAARSGAESGTRPRGHAAGARAATKPKQRTQPF